jgi:hypothetical protein
MRHIAALLVVVITLSATAALAPAVGAAGPVSAYGSTFCDELTSPDFGQVANKAQAKIVLKHIENSAVDAPRPLRRALRRVIAFYRRAARGDVSITELATVKGRIGRAIAKVFTYVEAHCPQSSTG